MTEEEEVRAAWDAIDEKTKETLRAFGIRPSCDADELDAAIEAWRGLTDEERASVRVSLLGVDGHAADVAVRLLKAAGR